MSAIGVKRTLNRFPPISIYEYTTYPPRGGPKLFVRCQSAERALGVVLLILDFFLIGVWC